MTRTTCANCNVTQGPFETVLTGKPLCKFKSLEACTERRKKLDRERWSITKETQE